MNLISQRYFDSAKFRAEIPAQLWDDRKQSYDHNDTWKKCKDLFLTVCNIHAPI